MEASHLPALLQGLSKVVDQQSIELAQDGGEGLQVDGLQGTVGAEPQDVEDIIYHGAGQTLPCPLIYADSFLQALLNEKLLLHTVRC